MYTTFVSLFLSYLDSERVDVTVTFEQPNGTFRKEVRRNVPVVIKSGLPIADLNFVYTVPSVGVPTVEAIERGGKKSVLHNYK